MKKSKNLLAILLVFCTAIAHSQDLVILGDSLSDGGTSGTGYSAFVKLVLQTNDTYPQPPYYEVRFSNGPVWIEVAAKQLSVGLANYASGGATTGVVIPTLPPLQPPIGGLTVPQSVLSPNLFQQINSLLLDNKSTLNPSSIYIIEIGDNDFFPTLLLNTTNTAQQTFANIQTAVGTLYAHGARKFVFAGVPSVTSLPVFTQPAIYGPLPNASPVDSLAAALNTLLQQFATQVSSTYPGASGSFFDFGGAFLKLATNAQAYGLTNIQQACYVIAPDLTANTPQPQPVGFAGGTLCADPDVHLFWDQFHPSRVAHEFIGAYFVQTLGPSLYGRTIAPSPTSGAPAPSTGLPVLPFLNAG